MPEQRVQRRLAAILAADVVGYSALMQRAEEATYAEFERLKRELIQPGLSRHEGRLIKTTGDGALAEFASPLAAVGCAVEIQDGLASGSYGFKLLECGHPSAAHGGASPNLVAYREDPTCLAGGCTGVGNIPLLEPSRFSKCRCLPRGAMSVVGSRAEDICSL